MEKCNIIKIYTPPNKLNKISILLIYVLGTSYNLEGREGLLKNYTRDRNHEGKDW